MRYLIILLMFISQLFLNSCSQSSVNSQINDSYDFPVNTGTSEWNSISSYTERLEACQIPEEVLKDMSTPGLAETVFNYPFFGNMLAWNTPQEGIEAITAEFNGLSELLKRDDNHTAMLAIYKKKLDKNKIENLTNDTEKEEYAFKLAYFETILMQDNILSKMSKKELKELLVSANQKYKDTQQSEIFCVYNKKYTSRLMGNVLFKLDFSPFVKEIQNNETLRKFLDDGYLRSERDIEIIDSFTNKFLPNK